MKVHEICDYLIEKSIKEITVEKANLIFDYDKKVAIIRIGNVSREIKESMLHYSDDIVGCLMYMYEYLPVYIVRFLFENKEWDWNKFYNAKSEKIGYSYNEIPEEDIIWSNG